VVIQIAGSLKLTIVFDKQLDPGNIEILKSYTLVDYDHDMQLLYHDLKCWLDERFNGGPPEFLPNQRIVFWHTDLDYYIHNDFPGFTLYNLQLILKELDISNYFCAIVVASVDYQKYTELARETLTTDDFAMLDISVIYVGHRWIHLLPKVTYQSNVTYPFIVLSRRPRLHRTYFMSQLFNNQLHTHGLVAYNNIADYTPAAKDNTNNSIHCSCNFLYTVPFRRNNDNIRLQKEKNRIILQEFLKATTSFKNFSDSININDHTSSAWESCPQIQDSLVYVGLESVATYPGTHVSMISMKCMYEKRPFIIFATPGHIARLKQLGFKTFSDFWDEGYDNINDLEDRVDAIIAILKSLSKLSVLELNHLLSEMQSIIDYNYTHLTTNFESQEINKFYQGLIR
jgi:hypothetical protein